MASQLMIANFLLRGRSLGMQHQTATKEQKAAYFFSKDHVTFTTCQFGRKTGTNRRHIKSQFKLKESKLVVCFSELVIVLFG